MMRSLKEDGRHGQGVILVSRGLLSSRHSRRKLSLHPADVFLLDLARPDLLLHLPGLLGIPSEEEES